MHSELNVSCGKGQGVLVASPLQEVCITKFWAGLNGLDPRNDLVLSGIRIGMGCMNLVAVISQVPITLKFWKVWFTSWTNSL